MKPAMTPAEKWRVLNQEFRQSFERQAEDSQSIPYIHYSGGLAEALVEKSPLAVIGINWGGNADESQWDDTFYTKSSLGNERERSAFVLSVRQLFSKALGSESEAFKMLKETFYTNRCLFKTTSVDGLCGSSLWKRDKQTKASFVAVSKMLSIVRPNLILCCGNAMKCCCPSKYILHDLCAIPLKTLWRVSSPDRLWEYRCERWVGRFVEKSLVFPRMENKQLLEVSTWPVKRIWSFPHPSVGNWPSETKFPDDLLNLLASDLRACFA